MTHKNELLAVVQRLASDEEFRSRLTTAPRETLVTELGICREDYDALLALLPMLFMGGLFLFGDGGSVLGPDDPGWGRWGAR